MQPPASAVETAAQAVMSGPGLTVWAIFLALLPPAVVILAALGGALWQRKIARQTLTFNIIERQLWDEDYIRNRRAFILIRENTSSAGLAALVSPAQAGTEEAGTVRLILNNYEIISIGIRDGVLDGGMYDKFFRTTLLKDFESMRPFIEASQKDVPRAYVEYAKLYDDWKSTKR